MDYVTDILPLLEQGLKHKDIAKRFDVTQSAVSQVCRRHRISQTALATAKTLDSSSVADRAAYWIAVMSTDVRSSFARLLKFAKPRTFAQEMQRERVLELLNKRARLTYGLDAAGAKSVVVGISVKLGTNLTPQDIDVQATAESTPGHSAENTPDNAEPAK